VIVSCDSQLQLEWKPQEWDVLRMLLSQQLSTAAGGSANGAALTTLMVARSSQRYMTWPAEQSRLRNDEQGSETEGSPGLRGVALVLGVTMVGVIAARGEVREEAEAMPVPIRRPAQKDSQHHTRYMTSSCQSK
jgi:hypothetical protein